MRAAPESFDEVLGPLIGHGYALAITMLNDRPAAEDAVQEASIKAWRKLPGLRDRAALMPWFLSIVANECRSVRRGRWWSVLKSPDIASAWSGGDPRSAEGLDLDRVYRSLDRLRVSLDLTGTVANG